MSERRRDLLLLFVMLAITAVGVLAVGPPTGDLANYHVAARLLTTGEDLGRIYDYRWFTDHATAMGYQDRLVGFAVLTPPSALLLAPLAGLSPDSLARVWMGLQGLLLVGVALTLARTVRKPAWWGFAPLLAIAPALQSHLQQGQLHLPVVLAIALAGLFWGVNTTSRSSAQGQLLAGVCIGFAVVMKVHAWPLLLVALVARRWWVLFGAALTGAVLVGLSVALLGVEVHRVFLHEIAPAAANSMFTDPWHLGKQSLSTALHRGMLPHPVLNPLPAWPSGAWLLGLHHGVLAAMVGLSALPALHWSRLSPRERAGTLAAASIAAMVAGPLLARYHLVLLAPALAWGAATLPRRHVLGLAVLAPLATGMPVPNSMDPGALFLLAVPRFWLCLAAWALLMPWGWTRRHSGSRAPATTVLAVSALLALVPRPTPAPDGAIAVDDPAMPLIASDLILAADGRLLFTGLTADRQDFPGSGWLGFGFDPDSGQVEILTSAKFTHAWSPRPTGGFQAGATGAELSPIVAGPEGGRLLADKGDIYWIAPSGDSVPVTTHPGHDDWPVWDPARNRVWFLSDRGVGVRALRLHAIDWPEGGLR